MTEDEARSRIESLKTEFERVGWRIHQSSWPKDHELRLVAMFGQMEITLSAYPPKDGIWVSMNTWFVDHRKGRVQTYSTAVKHQIDGDYIWLKRPLADILSDLIDEALPFMQQVVADIGSDADALERLRDHLDPLTSTKTSQTDSVRRSTKIDEAVGRLSAAADELMKQSRKTPSSTLCASRLADEQLSDEMESFVRRIEAATSRLASMMDEAAPDDPISRMRMLARLAYACLAGAGALVALQCVLWWSR